MRAGNALSDPTGDPIFINPATGRFQPFAPTIANPFTGFILPGAGASGINIIANDLQNPMVQQFNFGVQREFARDLVVRADYLHNFGTRFIIGRNIGVVNNPVVGGPDRVVNLESSVKTKYDGLLVSLEKRFACSVAAGIFLLFAGASGGSGYLAAALIGFGYGAESATIPYLVSRYFGLRSFGEIYSYLFITVPLGGALGPVLMGVGFDRTGSYQTMLLLCGVATMAAAALMLRLGYYPAFARHNNNLEEM